MHTNYKKENYKHKLNNSSSGDEEKLDLSVNRRKDTHPHLINRSEHSRNLNLT